MNDGQQPLVTEWVIDVCITCGRVARWPFCEHRPDGYQANPEPWCVPVNVKASTAGRTAMAKARRRRAQRSA